MDFSCKVVEQDGSGGFDVIASMDGLPATSPITTVRNGMGSLGLRFPRSHPFVGAMCGSKWLFRELQVFRGSDPDPYWWGVPVNPGKALGSEMVDVQCAEVIPWLLSRRYLGRAQRRNYLEDPSLESGAFAPNWATTGVDTATVITTDHVRGDRAAQLVEASAAPDASLQQTVNFTSTAVGNLVILAGWYRVVSWSGPALENRGLFYEWRLAGVLKQHFYEPITVREAVNEGWQRAESTSPRVIWIPPNTTVAINVRGYAITGTIRWDSFFLGVMESTGAHPWTGSDIGGVAALIVNDAQSATYGKDDCDIDPDMPTTGHIIWDVWQHAEHANSWTDALGSLVQRENGLDFGYIYTANSRTIKGYDRTGGAPGKGTDRTALNLALPNAYVADYGWGLNGNEAASDLVLMGDGDGADREDGASSDATLFGGRGLEWISQTPPNTPIGILDERAAKAAKPHRRPGTYQLQLRPGVIWATGDRITLPAYDGAVLPGTYRVADTAHNPFTDAMIVSVEKEA